MSSRFAKNSILGALAGGAIALASFFSSIAVARTLGVNETGSVAYVIWLVWMAAPFVDLGLSSAIGRFVPFLRGSGQTEVAKHLGRMLARRLAISALAAAACTVMLVRLYGDQSAAEFLSGGTAAGAPMSLVVLVILLVVGQALTTYVYAHLRGRQEFGAAAHIAGASLLLQVVLVSIGSLLFGVTGALAGYAAGMLLPAVVCVSMMFGPASVDRVLSRRVTSFALFCWGANVTSALVWSRIELFFLERYWGMESVAMFAVALALTQLAIQGPVLLTGAVLTSLAEKRGRDELDGMKDDFAAAVRLLAALVFPICLGTAAIIPELLPVLYGGKFSSAVPAAMILVSIAALSVLSTVATSLVQALERSDFIFASSLCGAACALAAGFLLIPEYGLMGAALVRVAIQILMISLGCWFVVSRLGFAFPVVAVLKLGAAALASAAAASICIRAIGHPSSMPFAIVAGAVTYLVALRVANPLEASDVAFLSNLARPLPPALVEIATRLIAFVSTTKRDEKMLPP
ncbi:oligosaccharide flippase family protein [Bradyrhizobium sp. CSA112]|uniref:oligosaccharide flippase family protein n=1 Tax=Bradyrhizobium sp. CSA112 TaxID=2699170 RepID=UPI0023B1EF8B|nr:polysaccharide biosynthesis C-terminal domain-containing protein [Bradyrhizobium sp. CSA112]MDE5457930.1 oligosaccharide flippase family protein [Bradyrhizobium sp. CSA112]